MQQKGFFARRKVAVTLCLVLLMLVQQVAAGSLASQDQLQSSSDRSAGSPGDHTVGTLRRIARMTPLWRIMNSKPFGAYCQNNYECSTGLCRGGHCSISHRPASEPVKY